MDMEQACLKGMDSPPQSAEEKPSKDAAQKAKGPRKRTKTGCLTCRKRRIKCGEEKPRCNNCIKSKRECEGYGQRVVFRHPVGPIPHLGPIRQIQGMGGMPGMPMMAGSFGHSMQHIEAASASRPALLPIAPRPSYHHAHPDDMPRHHSYSSSASDPYASSTHLHSAISPDQPPYTWDSVSYSDGSYIPTSSAAVSAAAGTAHHYATSTCSASYPSSEAPYPHQEYAYEDTNTGWDDAGQQLQPYEAAAAYQAQLSLQGLHPHSSIVTPTPEYVRHDHVSTTTSTATTATTYTATSTTTTTTSTTLVPKLESKEVLLFPHSHDANALNQHRQQHNVVMHDVGEESDDYYDVETDEEPDDQYSSAAPAATAAASTACYTVPGKDSSYYPSSALAVSNPPFASYMNYDNLLATYRPSPLTSPLIDPEVAKIFSHFIGSIGTIISIFERKSSIAPFLNDFCPLPTEQQSLFTHTLPTLALENHGLLHSILALGSAHLANTTGQSSSPAFRHYHFALRRISKAVGLPQKRKQIPTLAATLLLGFFEVIAAEHSKWCSHVAGASQLIRDIDFAGMTRRIRAMRARARKQKSVAGEKSWTRAGDFRLDTFFENDIYAPIEREIDVDLVGAIIGRETSYDDATLAESEHEQPLTAKDIEDHRIRTDLYWHYCKQDLFQSLISGNPLLLPYDKWAQTPPRSAVGRIQTAYGTMDHLLLLLARISAFGVRDRKRKLKVMEENGGEWRPPPNMFPPGMARPPPAAAHSTGGAPGGPPRPKQPPPSANRDKSPPMYGMLPAGPVKLFSGFAAGSAHHPSGSASSPSTTSTDETDLDARTAQAEAEWQDILAACERFEQAMGPAFAPLPPDGAPLITSPFGPALQYRTHIIGCIWGLYYMGRIILHRFHPSMPPAATMAAVVAAPRTAQYAQNIGRVAAGIPYDHRLHNNVNNNSAFCSASAGVGVGAGASSNLNVTIAGVLHELTVCLFFAAVQYVNPAQRAWTVAMLRDISIITGSKSPIAIARGCETSWTKAFEAGRGPPHQRMVFDFDPNLVCSREGVVADHSDDRRWVAVHRGGSISWAMGLLSIDNDYAGGGE
ncbi:hypothetical protein MGYG_02927 [Nannizzia gypsea CBS 118893]|uniref:Zn(2)-C6 fungal-type domain-containing protein n=1 Tax=Arthroderma gypseum (strain ATCC MYA-4604 / CBS 118893) TaxID=535722 RepID=E4UPU8_ARTGP|nr:hypothetical protein MGYG_02927 [Nannizzia gypsea CBS 118893]EFQ99920.1 hypothetical protein MGYG_02927 [Nannizzia gypsea CBS 118893]